MDDRILLAHGSGGKLSHELVQRVFLPSLANPALNKLDDSAILETSGHLAFTTDGYVVRDGIVVVLRNATIPDGARIGAAAR